MLCRRHHRAIHEEGYRVERQDDGVLRFWRPDGEIVPEVPTPASVPAEPVSALCEGNEAYGVTIDPRASIPNWTGERLSVPYGISVLHPLAATPREPISVPARSERSDPVFSDGRRFSLPWCSRRPWRAGR